MIRAGKINEKNQKPIKSYSELEKIVRFSSIKKDLGNLLNPTHEIHILFKDTHSPIDIGNVNFPPI